ncbi:SDR family oxidoreductase [Spongiibacter nanhainus]|uniref:SDR family oxidoreductase n=1 Tax=Spongiibacter nanhainus TaxID=2794344 RepID=A0A7T4R0C8_9GAMM|nr:fatty acyl-CoA reductase [Spongiibacter nanhainus]QQD17984.1 SDR family oxidoreductase [Spongiibacter nanhainus]
MRDINRESSPTLRALKGKNILITGTTGFLGKVVLEKLIRTVPDLGDIYLLMRGNRRNPDARSRFLNEIASSSIFDTLRETRGEWFESVCEHRIHCVTGEVTQPQFGLSRSAFMALASDVDAIVNSAASVNFREELDRALEINTYSLNNIIELAEAAGNVPVIQVSTCYVNGFNQGAMREENVTPARLNLPEHQQGYFEIYSTLADLEEKVEQCKGKYEGRELKKHMVDLGIREAHAAGWNDTYTFTKWLGEQLLLKRLRDYPLTILRPSIIESTLREPTPGWIEGVKVADAVLMAYARGKVSFFPGKRNAVIDVIPADLVANGIILSLAEQFADPDSGRIYQCCSGARNPLTMGKFIDLLMTEAKENHQTYHKLFTQPPRRNFVAVDKRLFTLVAACARFGVIAFNQLLGRLGLKRKVRARRNLDTAIELSTLFSFYAQPKFVFHNDKLLSLSKSMGAVDQELFPVDPAAIDWSNYICKVHMAGLNSYALSDKARPRTEKAVDAATEMVNQSRQADGAAQKEAVVES